MLLAPLTIENLEFVMAVVGAAEERRSPVLQTLLAPSSTQAQITLLWFVVLRRGNQFLLLFT